MLEDGSLSPALSRDALLQLLRSTPSFFALAGYTLTVIEGMSPTHPVQHCILFTSFITGAVSVESSPAVPLASWIMVALGILSSLILLTQPIWWDRYVKTISI